MPLRQSILQYAKSVSFIKGGNLERITKSFDIKPSLFTVFINTCETTTSVERQIVIYLTLKARLLQS